MAETMAVFTAINFALNHGFDFITVLYDSYVLFNMINIHEMKLEI